MYYDGIKNFGSFVINIIFILYWKRKKGGNYINDIKIEDPEIIRLYRWYCRQKLLCHAQIIVALFMYQLYLRFMTLLIDSFKENPFFFLEYLPWTHVPLGFISFTMIEGVRLESNRKMIYYYLFSLVFFAFQLCILTVFISHIGTKYIVIYIVFIIIPFLLTIITVINSIICHRNFGKGLKIYLIYEPKTFKKLIKYNDDLDQCYIDEN
ncbi:hypothetical protein GLOIN_2v1776151 [Rhizophagus clarus]|uniref:Uncharacterized protein n=1 Tax=Rhizophagus clarus TaxID=94130 RepID=A0A8H3QFD0_9GLOM|nr:hypothetical protein GLOIN_2v1776151 [Rhizophagus clarus]